MDKNGKTKVLIYVPSFTGLIDSLTVESIGYILFDCFNLKAIGYEFFFIIGKRMAIHDSRNHAIKWAIENDMEWIFWFDDDMVLDKAAKPLFTTLMSHNKDFVAPLFFQRRAPYLPLLFKKNVYMDGVFTTYDNILDYKKGLIEVDGVGFGCCLTRVEMFKKIKEPYFEMGSTFGEDLYFCAKATNAGYKIYCDTTITVGHIGDVTVAWEDSFKRNIEPARLFMEQKHERDLSFMENLGGVVDIVMPCYHNFEITKTAIESIINNTIACKWNLILVNDGGDKDLERYFRQIEKYRNNIRHVTNKKALGCIKATNQGLAMATSPYVCLINNDTEIQSNMKHWLHRMIQMLKEDGVGAVAPVSNYVFGIQDVKYNSKIIGTECYANFLIPFCAVYKKEVLDKIGLFSEEFQTENGAASNDDLDHSIRMVEAGYKLKIARDVFVYHHGSKSLGKICGGMKNLEQLHEDMRKKLIEKHGKERVDKLFDIQII